MIDVSDDNIQACIHEVLDDTIASLIAVNGSPVGSGEALELIARSLRQAATKLEDILYVGSMGKFA